MGSRVDGKVAIVTGAGNPDGMGAAFARRLAEEGARVMVTDLLEGGEGTMARMPGGNVRFMRHDVTKEAEWQRVVAETEEAFGPVSVLVNNAGISGYGPLETMTEAEFRHVIDIDLVSVFLGMKSVVPSMKRAGGGSIVNISSGAGIVGVPYAVHYVGAKFGVRGMSKGAAIELAPHNIRVNSVHPGYVRTPMTTTRPDIAEMVSQACLATPAGRMGEPVDVANVVLMLASDESRFSTGAEFVVDGGLCCQ